MYDYEALEQQLGVNRHRLGTIVNRYKIQKTYVGKKPFFTEDDVIEMKKHLKKFTPNCQWKKKGCLNKNKPLWKVSVLSDEIGNYIVKAVCLTEGEAKDFCRQLNALGFLSRASKHKNSKGVYYYG